jgi:hypothetical protein
MLNVREAARSATPSPSLAELITTTRDAHLGVISAFSNAIEHALTAGRALNLMEDTKLVRHSEWAEIYKQCDIGDRQAQRYKQLARVADSNPTFSNPTLKSDLAGMTIEGAIKKLSPPKNPSSSQRTDTSAKSSVRPKKLDVIVPATAADILDPWLRASPETRQHAVDGIGLRGWLDAVPGEWLPQLGQLIAERWQPPIAIAPPEPAQVPDNLSIPDDLSLPAFLRRDHENTLQVVTDINAVEIVDEPEEADRNRHDQENNAPDPTDKAAAEEADDKLEPEPEPEFKPKRKVKLVEHERTLADAIDIAFSDLSDLAGECRDVVDSASISEGLQQTYRIQTLEQSADELENIEAPDIEDVIATLPVNYAFPKRKRGHLSRAARAADASTILEACVSALNSNINEANRAAAQELIADLENTIAIVESCEFPGMYG